LVHLATERPSPRQPSGWRGFYFSTSVLRSPRIACLSKSSDKLTAECKRVLVAAEK